jgi:hypothetical protein
MWKTRNACKILVLKPEERRPLGRPRGRWEYNIKNGFKVIGCEVLDWVRLPQERDEWCDLIKIVKDPKFPQIAANFLTSLAINSFSSRNILNGTIIIIKLYS